MSRNRSTRVAPMALTSLSKTTLVDMLWELAAVAPDCKSCDDRKEVLRIIREAALQVNAPPRDIQAIERHRDRMSGPDARSSPADGDDIHECAAAPASAGADG